MTESTQIPWHVDQPSGEFLLVRDSSGVAVCDCGYRDKLTAIANAKFIVAACNNYEAMLTALEKIVALDDGDAPYWWRDENMNILNEVRSALELARKIRAT